MIKLKFPKDPFTIMFGIGFGFIVFGDAIAGYFDTLPLNECEKMIKERLKLKPTSA